MKPFTAALFLLLLAAPLSAAELVIISTEHREPAYFKRFSEYFTGRENPGRYEILRTQPDQRQGFYISLRASEAGLVERAATVRIDFIRPGTQDIETVSLPAADLSKRRLLLGLTDPEWQAPDSRPVAWQIQLLDPSHSPLATAQSFLWSN